MGIDITLRGLVAEADIDAARSVLTHHDPHAWIDVKERYVFVESLHRFYGESYQRGHWPTIRAMLVDLQRFIPQLEYGNDCGRFIGDPVCSELLDRLDALWAAQHPHTPSASSSA